MQNPWLSVEECEEDCSDCFMGVFTRPPAEIAASLPRPLTPFYNPQSSVPPIHTKLSEISPISSSSSIEVESPVIHARAQAIFNSLVTVF